MTTTLIAGPVWVNDYPTLEGIILDAQQNLEIEVSKVIEGGAKRGVDLLARTWAIANGLDYRTIARKVSVTARGGFPSRFRNWKAAKEADAIIVIWDAQSEYIANLILQGHALEVPMYVRMLQRPATTWDAVPGYNPPKENKADGDSTSAQDEHDDEERESA